MRKFAQINTIIMPQSYITLEELTGRISGLLNTSSSLRNVWVTAETSDLRRSGHCYLELIQKHPDTGEPIARMRATIWRSVFARIDADFFAATGQRLDSGMKVMVQVSVNFHPSYGLSLNITDIDPAYTLGDLLRIRMEILARLKREGVIDLNRSLDWCDVPLRIAVVSAPGAAGYGDFIHQLYSNDYRLKFTTKLFPALMQGAQAPMSIIGALEQIAMEEEDWDCVVIIRGGGATSDLASFENYDLAANVAQFPLPIIIGIGHERDITVLDYVANMRVKTPTAAAEWLIGRGGEALTRLDSLASSIHHVATSILAGNREQLAYISASLPYLPAKAIDNARKRLDRDMMGLAEGINRRLQPEHTRLNRIADRMHNALDLTLERRRTRLNSIEDLLKVLSPQATLSRGYSITRFNGKAITSAEFLPEDAVIETTLADGVIVSRTTTG